MEGIQDKKNYLKQYLSIHKKSQYIIERTVKQQSLFTKVLMCLWETTPNAENCEDREDTVPNRPNLSNSHLFLSEGYEHCQQHTGELHSAECRQALLVLEDRVWWEAEPAEAQRRGTTS